ncbi:MAG: hypothetical protein Q8S73_18300 [Deltaproteobacteria bacterium]|nr:hypothetical protein [Myxococcales bacterium]MDP3216064.1 hypothetical protein [Deltaproteobacteria bacterium]
MTTLDPFAAGDLRIDATAASSPAVVCLAWSGKSNARQADQVILPYLERSLAAAADLGAALELRFEALNHFNSSTIAAIIHVIQLARRRGVRLVVVSDPRRQWQRLSFDALRVFVQPDGLFELRAVGDEGGA